MSNEQLIETIEKALEAATPGTWEVNVRRGLCVEVRSSTEVVATTICEENANLIANAPEWLRALLEENERLKKYVATTNYNSEKLAIELTVKQIELSAKDKVLEDFANGDPYATKHKARSILSQYQRREEDEKRL